MNKNKVLSGAFGWLFIGLLVCFITSFLTSINETVFTMVYGSLGGFSYIIFTILELALAIYLSVRIFKMNPLTAKIVYLLYTMLSGLTLTGLLMIYTASSVCYVFLATALVFGSFAIIGRYTKTDLSSWITYLFIALIAILVLEIINIFLMNNTLNMILGIVGVLLFCAYTAYDVQKAYKLSSMETPENTSIYCAFRLFLDFINIFIDLLRLFGRSRD